MGTNHLKGSSDLPECRRVSTEAIAVYIVVLRQELGKVLECFLIGGEAAMAFLTLKLQEISEVDQMQAERSLAIDRR
jgi:hypothetical protein